MPPLDDLAAAAGLTQNADGTWGLAAVGPAANASPLSPPPAAGVPIPALQPGVTELPTVTVHARPPAPTGAPVVPAGAAPAAGPPDLATAAGLVQLPDGTWGMPGTTTPPPTPAANGSPAPAVPPSVEAQELRNQPWNQQLVDTIKGLGETVTHGMSLGLNEIVDPVVPAALHSLETGIPFTQSYKLAQEAMAFPRQQFQQEHPDLATVTSIAAGLPASAAMSPLFGEAGAGATAMQRVLMAMRNLAANIGIGGGTSFTMSDGDLEQRLQAAKQGAGIGAALGVGAPLISTAAKAVAAPFQAAAPLIRPQGAAEGAAGNALLEAAGGQVPTMQPPPVTGMTQDVAQATNNPGLAQVVRLRNEADQTAAVTQRTAQNAEVRQAATGGTAASGPLAAQMPVADASAQVVSGMQKASDVLRAEERRRWTVDPLTQMKPDLDAVKDRVAKAIEKLPLRVQRAIENNGDLKGTLADLQGMADGATLADVNDIRSDLLTVARTLPRTEGLARRAANIAAQAVLEALENNPAMKADPRAWAAYKAARGYTARMWDVMGHDEFQSMLKTNRFGNQAGDVGTMANRVFNTAAGTEVSPGRVAGVGRMLDQVQRQWSALRAAGIGGTLDPVAATAAREELTDGARNFIINRMLDDASSITLDQTGQPLLRMNRLADWIDTNRPWIGRSGLFNPDQLDALDRVREAAEMVQRTENLRGGSNSATFERLAGDRFLDAFLSPITRHVSGAVIGAGLGAALGQFVGEAGLGAIFGGGIEGGGLGQMILRRLYDMPKARAMALIDQAIRDPQIAKDLMMKADAANAKKFSPATTAFLRAAMAAEVPGQIMQHFGPGASPPAGSSGLAIPAPAVPGAAASP